MMGAPEGLLQPGFSLSLLPYRPVMQPSSSAWTTFEVSTSPLPVQSSRSRICACQWQNHLCQHCKG